MRNARLLLYIAVIAAAPTLREPWMVAMQAALGGIMIGVRLEKLRCSDAR